MKNMKWSNRIFAGVLIVIWIAYAVTNMVTQAPALNVGDLRGWDFDSRLENMKQTANGSFLFHNFFQDANGYKNLVTDRKMIQVGNNLSVIQGKDGYLYYSNNFPYENYDFSTQALQLREVQNVVQEKGGSMLFVNFPDLYIEGFSESMSEINLPISNLNARSNAMLYALQGYDIATMDSRQVLTESNLKQSEFRYKTEPHWTIQAGFEVYLSLLDWMKERGSSIGNNDFFADRNNYTQTVYRNAFTGQMGKRVGIPYSGNDDFVLIEPSFDTNFALTYNEKSTLRPKEGDFSSVLLEKRWLSQSSPYERNMYNTYMTSLYTYRQINNNLNLEGPKILIIGDTYMLPVASLLATAASEVTLLWPYGLPDMGEDIDSLIDYIEASDFEHVIIGMSPGSMYDGGFNFLEGIDIPE